MPTAAGLLAGAGAMVVADREPQQRDRGQATAADGLALGFAQAAALAPGVSRNGATLSVARWRGFTRQHAEHAVAHGRAARDRRGGGAQGRAAAAPRAAPEAGHGVRRRDRRLLRLHPRLSGPDPGGRARQRPVAVRGLPSGPRRGGAGQALAPLAEPPSRGPRSRSSRDLPLRQRPAGRGNGAPTWAQTAETGPSTGSASREEGP